jgi:hypothetical protein
VRILLIWPQTVVIGFRVPSSLSNSPNRNVIRVPGGSGKFHFRQAGKVLSEIDDVDARLGGGDVLRSERLLQAGGGHDQGAKRFEGMVGGLDRTPARFVEARLVPAGEGFAGITDFAKVNTVPEGGALGGFPLPVGGDDGLGSVRVIDDEAGDPAGAANGEGLAQVPAPPHPQGKRVVPSIPEGDADTVDPLLQLIGDVEGSEKNPFFKVGPGGREGVVGKAFAVQAGVREPEPGDMEAGSLDRLGKLEFTTQQRSGIVFVEILIMDRVGLAVIDPEGAVPIFGRERGNFPEGRFAPGRDFSVGVPAADLPVTTLTGGRSFPGIVHLR